MFFHPRCLPSLAANFLLLFGVSPLAANLSPCPHPPSPMSSRPGCTVGGTPSGAAQQYAATGTGLLNTSLPQLLNLFLPPSHPVVLP